MAERQLRSGSETIPAAIGSLIVGLLSAGLVAFAALSTIQRAGISSSGLIPVTGGIPASGAIWGVGLTIAGFVLGFAGIVTGFSAIPEPGKAYPTIACKWMCRAGIGINMLAVLAGMFIISFMRAFVLVP